MIIDTERDKKAFLDGNFNKHSPAHMVMMRLMVELYNSIPDPSRPTKDSLPEGAEEKMMAVLRYVGESSVFSYTGFIQGINFTLAPGADIYSIFKEFKTEEVADSG